MKHLQIINHSVVVLFISIMGLLLITSCKDSKDITEPTGEAKLVIDSGYYSHVKSANPAEYSYTVTANYHVEGSDFIIGNYAIEWKTENIGKDYFPNSLVVNPDRRISIVDTFTFPREVMEGPIVTISGYALNQKDDGTTTKASFKCSANNTHISE